MKQFLTVAIIGLAMNIAYAANTPFSAPQMVLANKVMLCADEAADIMKNSWTKITEASTQTARGKNMTTTTTVTFTKQNPPPSFATATYVLTITERKVKTKVPGAADAPSSITKVTCEVEEAE